jgi:hypothetical protein
MGFAENPATFSMAQSVVFHASHGQSQQVCTVNIIIRPANALKGASHQVFFVSIFLGSAALVLGKFNYSLHLLSQAYCKLQKLYHTNPH